MKIEIDLNINVGLSEALLSSISALIAASAAEPRERSERTLGEVAADKATAEPAKTRGRPKKEAPKAEAPADPAPAEVAQDTADEQAEAAAEKADGDAPAGAPKVYDVNDMRAAGKAYADAYGMPATLKDIPGIIGFAAFSQVPEDKIDAVTRLVLQAVEQNPHGHSKVA